MLSALLRRVPAWLPVCAASMVSVYSAGVVSAVESASPETATADSPASRADTIDVPGVLNTPERELAELPYYASIRDLDDGTERLISLADILEQETGVQVRRYGGIGSYATASIRGSAPGQVEVYLDGFPVQSAQWGVTNLSTIPVDHLARAEIYRSGAPATFGTPGIGGVVNLVSRPVGRQRTIATITGGSYNTWKSAVIHGGNWGGFEHLLSLRQLQTDGDYSFLYDPGTRSNPADDSVRTRENNRFVEEGILFKLRTPEWNGWRLALHDDWYFKDSGLPGHGNLVYEAASFDNRRHMLGVEVEGPAMAGGRLRTEASGFHLYRRDRYYNPGNEPGLSRNDLIHRSNTTGAKILMRGYWWEAGQIIDLVAERKRDRFTPEEDDPRIGAGFERERRSWNLAVEDRLALIRNRLNFFATYRYQEVEDNFHGEKFSFLPREEREDARLTTFRGNSVGARAELTSTISVKTSRTVYARFPTLFELFGTNGDVVENYSLVPEEGTTWDAGLRWELMDGMVSRGSFELNAYTSDRDSLIYFVQNGRGNFVAQNLEHATAEGVEAAIRWVAPKNVSLRGSFTYQDVRHTGSVPHWNDKQLPYVSPRELSAGMNWAGPSWAGMSWAVRWDYLWYDRYYRDRANTAADRAPARSYQNAGVQTALPGGGLTLDFEVHNLTDEKTEDVYGFPMPGRTVYVTLEWDNGAR